MKRVLITGASGQDGIILSKLYLKKNFKVFGFVKNKKNFYQKKVNYKINSLRSKKKIIKDLDTIKPDIIIHLASSNDSFAKRKDYQDYKINYQDNFKYTKNLLDSVIQKRINPRIVFAGSSLMFRKTNKNKLSEKNSFYSSDYYGKYKIDSYKYILKLKQKYKIDLSTVILFNHDSKHRGNKFLIPRLIKAFIKKNTNFIEQIYRLNISGDFSHASDICNGIFKLSLSNKKIDKIILSSNKRTYINKIINNLEKIFSIKINKKFTRSKNNFKTLGSNLLAKKLLQYQPKKNLLDVCKELIKVYL